MFCPKCGNQLNDNAAFCPKCGEKIGVQAEPMNQFSPTQQIPQTVPVINEPARNVAGGAPANLQEYIFKGVTAVAAIIMAVVAVVFIVKIVNNVEYIIDVFSPYSGTVSALGTLGFVVLGILLAGICVLSALPVFRCLLENKSITRNGIDRSIVFSLVALILCICTWICKLIFHNISVSEVTSALYYIFSIYGALASSCIAPIAIALIVLYVLRTRFLNR